MSDRELQIKLAIIQCNIEIAKLDAMLYSGNREMIEGGMQNARMDLCSHVEELEALLKEAAC
jgi:hypothetical protein